MDYNDFPIFLDDMLEENAKEVFLYTLLEMNYDDGLDMYAGTIKFDYVPVRRAKGMETYIERMPRYVNRNVVFSMPHLLMMLDENMAKYNSVMPEYLNVVMPTNVYKCILEKAREKSRK